MSNQKKIWLSSPHLGQTEQQHVQNAFAQNWIAPLGPHVNGFEEDICKFSGAKHAAALSSGTAAIHLALELMDIGPGDVVFVSSFTFSATVNPILYQGALPVLIDSEPDTWNMDPNGLEQAIEATVNGKLEVDVWNERLVRKLPWLRMDGSTASSSPPGRSQMRGSEGKSEVQRPESKVQGQDDPRPKPSEHPSAPSSFDSAQDDSIQPPASPVGIHQDNVQLRPKAILPVHLYGMPANMSAIQQIADKYELPIIEDAAEAMGSSYKGQKCGSFGKLGIFSFNGNKIITTGGGGALVSDDEELIKKARFLATQARDPAPHYQHSHIGYNYRLSNVSAAIGRGQMEVLPKRVEQRRANFHYYKNALADLPGVSFLHEPSTDHFSNHWLTTILINPQESGGVTREKVRTTMQDNNIDCRPLWKPMHLQPIFEELPFFGKEVSNHLFDIGLCLPSGSDLTEDDLGRIVGLVRSCW